MQRLIFGATWLYYFISAFCEFLVCESLFSRRTFWCQNKVARMCRCPQQIPPFAKCTLQMFLFLDVFFYFSWYFSYFISIFSCDWDVQMLKCISQSFFCWNCLISFIFSWFFFSYFLDFFYVTRTWRSHLLLRWTSQIVCCSGFFVTWKYSACFVAKV